MRRVWTILQWAAIFFAAFVALLYAGDYFSVRYRMAHRTNADPLETTQIRPLYAVPLKNGRDEFDFGDSEPQTCVHSIFPHLGYNPCWYMNRENQTPNIILILPAR